MENIKEENILKDTRAEIALGESKDLNIDIYLEDNDDKVIYLIQSEFTGTSKKVKALM